MKNYGLKIKWLVCYSIICICLLIPFSAEANLVWDWSLDNTTLTVSPSDSIVIKATLFNDQSSTVVMENLNNPLVSSLLFIPGDFTPDKYKFYYGPPSDNDYYQQFSGLQLHPGESFHFTIGYWLPENGTAPAGTYEMPSIAVRFIDDYKQQGPFQADVVATPLPSSLFMLISGVLGFGLILKIRKRQEQLF